MSFKRQQEKTKYNRRRPKEIKKQNNIKEGNSTPNEIED